MPADEAAGLSPLSCHATHCSKADMPESSEEDDGAADRAAGEDAELACARRRALASAPWLVRSRPEEAVCALLTCL